MRADQGSAETEPPKYSCPSKSSAKAPFPPESRGDTILRSSDGVEFKLYGAILMVVSPIFADMLSSTPLISTKSASGPPDEVSTISLEEDAETLDTLFRCIDPLGSSKLGVPSLDFAHKLTVAAVKYSVPPHLLPLRKSLRSKETLQVPEDCFRVFGLAWRLGYKDIAELASRYTRSPRSNLLNRP